MSRKKPSATASAVLTRGDAREMARVFVAGSAVAPFSVGSCGDWCVTAGGVEPHHFFLCFDGQTLFAATAAGGPMSSVRGKRLVAAWTELPDGCVLKFGAASIAVTNLGQRTTRPPPLPAGRVDPRGPKIIDPFACETLVQARLSPLTGVPSEPLEEQTVVRPALAMLERRGLSSEPLEDLTVMRPALVALDQRGVPGEPLEEPTLWRRPVAAEFALQPFVRAMDHSLAETIARPVTAPMAITLNAPMSSVGLGPSGLSAMPSAARGAGVAARFASSAQAPLLRKGIAGLIVLLLVLMGVRTLTRRQRSLPVKAVAAVTSAASRSVTAAPSHVAVSQDKPRNLEPFPLPVASGKTAERQAVDLVARGAYSEAAALYDRLASLRDLPAFREAARIARRKARVAR